MPYYLLLITAPLIASAQSIFQKQYNLKSREPNIVLFSALTSLMALIFFICTSGFSFDFDARLVPYSLVFAVSYAAAWVGTVYAVRYGNIAVTSLIVSC